jgi:hypothetical protein
MVEDEGPGPRETAEEEASASEHGISMNALV